MFATFTFETAAAAWFDLFGQASVQSLLVLAVVIPFWLALRRHISHGFAHGLFLLVPGKFAAAILCGLMALQWPVEIPLPRISKSVAQIPAGIESDRSSETSLPGSLAKPDRTIPPEETGFESATNSQILSGAIGENRPTVASIPPEIEAVESSGQKTFEMPRGSVIAFSAWILICAILAARFVFLTLLMRTRAKRSSGQVSAQLSATVAEVSNAMGLRRNPRVATTSAVASPAVFGLIRPTLLIPEGFETAFEESETRWAIAHELAHMKRRDLWAVAFERFVGLAGFFHPALWLARRATGTFRELACDDIAGQVTGLPPRSCAEAFLKILVWADRHADSAQASPLVLGLNPRYPAIRKRIENMTDRTNSKRLARLGRVSRFLLTVMALITALPVVPKLVAKGPAKVEMAEQSAIVAQNPNEAQDSGVRLKLKDAANGQPIAGAEVLAFADNVRMIRNTDATGHVTIDFDPNRHHSLSLIIRHPGYVPVQDYRHRQMTSTFPPPRDMEIKLIRGKTIGGLVTDPNGKPIADAEVRVEFGMNDVRRLLSCLPVRTDEDGRWTTSSIDPACTSVVIQVRHPKFVMGPRPYEIAHRLVLRKPFPELFDRTQSTKMTPGHNFIATVLGPDGKPVEGARAYLSQFAGLLEDTGVASNAAGSIAIENLASLQGAPFRTLRVIVHKPGVGWHTVKLAENQFDKPMTVRLESPRKFALRVVDSDGKPIAGARILSDFLPPEMAIGMNQVTDENGTFEIAEFPPGKWRLTAGKGGFEVDSIVVDVASNNEATLVLKREILVQGTVKDSVSGKLVESFQVIQMSEDGDERNREWIGKGQGEGRFGENLNQRSKWLEGSEPKARLRIEAAGFEAFETESFLVSKPPAHFEIALKPDSRFRFVTGKVIGPDGKPAAGAEVAYFTPSVEGQRDFVPRIDNGRIVSIFHCPVGNIGGRIPRELIRTGADGTFRIPAASDQIGMVVTHESGGLRAAEAGPVPNPPVELKLQSFGRIEGQLLIEGKPAASKNLKFDYKFDDSPKEAYFSMPTPVVTDDQGRFTVDNIVPGKVRLRYDTPSGSGLKHYVGGPIPVGSGATTKLRADVDDFGLEESILNDAGQVVSKFAIGAKEQAFKVFGFATDAETGQPIEPVLAHLLTGMKGDDVSIQAFMSTIGKGEFETGPMRSKHVDLTKEKIDPYLVVSANGYETYVSPNRIPRANGSARIDVRLKKVDASKMKTYSGMIRLPDGSPAGDAKVGTTVIDDGIAVGDAKYRWTINENDVQDTDETGKFRIVAPREPDTIFISDKMGFAILKPAEFLEVAGRTPEVKLTPWVRIEGRLTQAGMPADKLEMTLSYDGVRLPRDQARQDVKVSRDGTFRISGVIARPAKLSIYSKSEQGRFVLVKTVTIEAKPGETTQAQLTVTEEELRKADEMAKTRQAARKQGE